VTGTFLSARLLRRLGKDFSSSRSYSSHADPRNQDHPGDIEMVLPLTSKEIEDGTSRKVSFLQNGTWVRLNVKVPPGVQPGYRLRLKQKGNTMPGGHGPGDLYLRIAVNQ